MKSIKYIIPFTVLAFTIGVICWFQMSAPSTPTIHIGYQSITSQTWGALILKNKGLVEICIHDTFGRDVEVEWHDEVSGAAINNQMIAGKYQIGFMGDMPALINGYKGTVTDNYGSLLIAVDGKGKRGKNQGVLVPYDSEIDSITELTGKAVSVPIGSSAHRMLLAILHSHDILDKVDIKHQDVTMASSLLKSNKVDAFAVWDPYTRYLVHNGVARLLVDGASSNVDYLSGIMVNKEWAYDNEDLVVGFLEGLLRAHQFIRQDTEAASKIFTLESGFPEEITQEEVRSVRWDAALYDKDKSTLVSDLQFLTEVSEIGKYDLDVIIDTKFLDASVSNLKLRDIEWSSTDWPDYAY